jgi:hypothetical protein
MGKGLMNIVLLWVTGDDRRGAERSGFELPPAREALTRKSGPAALSGTSPTRQRDADHRLGVGVYAQ